MPREGRLPVPPVKAHERHLVRGEPKLLQEAAVLLARERGELAAGRRSAGPRPRRGIRGGVAGEVTRVAEAARHRELAQCGDGLTPPQDGLDEGMITSPIGIGTP